MTKKAKKERDVKEGVAKRRTKITNTTCEQQLTNSQNVGPEGQNKVAEVIRIILSDDFEVLSEGSTIIVSTV